MEEAEIIVTNPDTNEQYNCNEIINLLYGYQNNLTKFNKCIELLNSCIEWDDSIEKQINKLKDIIKNSGLDEAFKKQLDKVSLYAHRKDEKYVPISEKFKELYLKQDVKKSISFLCPELDRITGGILPGTICTIAGGPGSMKTTTAVNIAYQAVKDGKNVCYLTLEEPPLQLFSKLLSRVSVDINKKLPVADIIQHKLGDIEQKILIEEALPYLINFTGSFQMIGERDLASYEFTDIERQLRLVDQNMKSRNNDNHGIDLIVVDHIQLLKYASNVKDEYRVMNDYVSFFRKQSLSFLDSDREISIILLSQVNREGIAYAQKHNGMYLMQHVAEASEVERASSYIITVFTDPMSQVVKLLKMGAIKLRGSQLPADLIQVYADGELYQVGDTYIPEQEDYSTSDILEIPETLTTEFDYSLESIMAGVSL